MSSNSKNSNARVSFSVKSKPNLKPKPSQIDNEAEDDRPKKEFVTEFDKTLTDSKKQKRIIIPPPPKPDGWRPHKKMKNLDLPISSDDPNQKLEWELEQKADADDDGSKISYGLNLRNNTTSNGGSNSNKDADVAAGSTIEFVASKDFKHELEKLPEDEGFQQFEDMPVEEFGAALLGGLGWYEGRGIGKNAKGNVKIKEFGKKTFASDDVISRKDNDKQRDSLNQSKESRTGQAADGDKQMKMKVKHQDSQKLASRKNEKRERQPSRESEKREQNKDKGSERVSWLNSHIRVRIISKEFKRGRLYLKKGEVMDVVGPTTCDISMDESGELIQGVNQDVLETALPRRGGPVLVLYGRHKGVYGNLVERDLDTETGIVRDADTHDLINVKLEQIAEYIGDPSYIGY